jgi:DNA mismatch repair protein MLH3
VLIIVIIIMHQEDNSIEQLPAATRTILRSTQILTSLPQIISELVQNALDANARNVEVSVDCQEWSCWVRDDGVGISRDGLNHLGLGPQDGRYSE